MNQVKVKAYGLVNFTKKQYTIAQVIGFGILVLLFSLSFFYDFDKFMLGNAKIFILVVTFLECVETFFMYKKFRKKESNLHNE